MERGDDMVGLGGGRKQRWRRGALLLPVDTRETGDREGEMKRRDRETGETEWKTRQRPHPSGLMPTSSISATFSLSAYLAPGHSAPWWRQDVGPR
jgi:hypothetical protein